MNYNCLGSREYILCIFKHFPLVCGQSSVCAVNITGISFICGRAMFLKLAQFCNRCCRFYWQPWLQILLLFSLEASLNLTYAIYRHTDTAIEPRPCTQRSRVRFLSRTETEVAETLLQILNPSQCVCREGMCTVDSGSSL